MINHSESFLQMLCERFRDSLARQLVQRFPWNCDQERLSEWLRRIASALLIASVVHLLQDFHLPLELPTNSLAVNMANHARKSHVADPLNDVAIVHLDLERFRSSRYQGVSPLDRCALAKDLRILLDNRDIETVAIDFFLSPTYRVTDEEKRCQKELDQVLDRNPGRIVAIRREPDKNEDRNKHWFDARTGVEFGHSDLGNEFGMVRNHVVNPSGLSSFADVVAGRLCQKRMSDELRQQRCAGLHRKADHATDHAEAPHFHPIVFRNLARFYREGKALRLDDPCLVHKAEACPPIRHVFLGSEFSEDDEFLTPIGVRVGVDVHAAIASEPRNHPSHVIGFMADVILGAFVFAPLIHWFWHGYFKSRTSATSSLDRERAYLWIGSLMSALGIAVSFLVVISTSIFVQWGIWISPVPMAIGTLIDGLIIGSVSVSTGLLSGVGHSLHSVIAHHGTAAAHTTDRTQKPSLKDFFRRPRSEWIVASFPCVTGVGIVVLAIRDLI